MFFFSGLMYGENSSLPVINYWRWWLVHLWVEGFFEVFATVVIAYIFSQMKIISAKTAGRVSVASATIFLAGGILGTLHHLYFSGTPVKAIALGATFSALEVVPLTLMGFEIRENWNLLKSTAWMQKYKWPIFFFYCRRFLEFYGSRSIWILNQSANCFVLYSGIKYHSCSCTYRFIWRIWNARNGIHFNLFTFLFRQRLG